MKPIKKSDKMSDVCYDIRGPIMDAAIRIENEGMHILKLNIGNPAQWGFDIPEELINDVVVNLKNAQGYCESKGLFSARKAIMQYSQEKNITGVDIEDIYIGNGVSELIGISMQALLNKGNEFLVPTPDYPLWTASVNLAGGKAIHYICDEESDWQPDIADIEKKITTKTRGIVIINPNNPTGSVYDKELLKKIIKLARKHNLIIFSDEIYDKILYDDNKHISIASLADDVLIVTFSGLSKNYRAAGFRAGWIIISGAKNYATDYIEGLNILSSMRLCSNVPAQFAIPAALKGYQSINNFLLPGGRLKEQRDYAWERINTISGLSCIKPNGALYLFPKINTKRFNITDDTKFIYDLLIQEHLLLVQGTGFNWLKPDHFRIVFLPRINELKIALDKLEHFLGAYKQG